MSRTRFTIALISSILLIAYACTVVKKDDPEKEVRLFLNSFREALAKSEDDALKLIDANQSKEALTSIIRILQNKEIDLITCDAAWDNAAIVRQVDEYEVSIPVVFRMNDGREENLGNTQADTLVLYVVPKETSFSISKISGEDFHKTFTMLANMNEWELTKAKELKRREEIYLKAASLKQSYDTVIWYANDQNKLYFYVASGRWVNRYHYYGNQSDEVGDYKMGVVDEGGQVVIPLEYDLVGTVSFLKDGIVEVTKDGKLGYFNIAEKRLVAEPAFDEVIPYNKSNVFALVKKGGVQGYLTNDYQYKEGFPDAAASGYLSSFGFLEGMKVNGTSHVICEIPAEEYLGGGVLIPANYLVKYGLFKPITSGIVTTSFPLNAWTEYIETQPARVESITDNLKALMLEVKERYLEGREEFYERNEVVFLDGKNDTLLTTTIGTEDISIRNVGQFVEVRSTYGGWYEPSDEEYLPSYEYYLAAEGQLVKQETFRRFPFTQYAKLDSSYFTGKFSIYNFENDTEEEREFLSNRTLRYMRDEILASYGYDFPDQSTKEKFVNYTWYQPSSRSLEEIQANMSEIDKYNLAFIERMIALTDVPQV